MKWICNKQQFAFDVRDVRI